MKAFSLTVGLFVVMLLSVLVPCITYVHAQAVEIWAPTTSYPIGVDEGSCVTYSGYIYCVGGMSSSANGTSGVYSAPLSVSGVGIWTNTTAYPVAVFNEACVVDSVGYIYCIGGYAGSSGIQVSSVYSASLSNGTVGEWTQTTSYPVTIAFPGCAVYSNYVYCGSGFNNGEPSPAFYYASLSSGTVGPWSSTTKYPETTHLSCITDSGYLYCVGGLSANGDYYATVSSSGIGTWKLTSSYPVRNDTTCTGYSVYVYCVTLTSAAVYYTSVSNSGLGVWTSAASYPTNVGAQACVANSGYLFCVGGDNSPPISSNSVYYASLSPSSLMTVSYSIVGGGSPTAPVFNYVQGGVSEQVTLTTTPTTVSVDSGSSWSVTNPLQGLTGSERWLTSQPVEGIALSLTINFTYQHQYLLTIQASLSGGGKVAPVSGFQNSGASVNIAAASNANYAFLSWTGTGSGSFTGTSNPATVTMNGPITETANFQQTGGQLSVSLVSPKNGGTVTSSPVTLSLNVAGFVQGATVTVSVDGNRVCSGSTSATGAFSCKDKVTMTGGTHTWYVVASKTGFTSGTSPTWTFTY